MCVNAADSLRIYMAFTCNPGHCTHLGHVRETLRLGTDNQDGIKSECYDGPSTDFKACHRTSLQ